MFLAHSQLKARRNVGGRGGGEGGKEGEALLRRAVQTVGP